MYQYIVYKLEFLLHQVLNLPNVILPVSPPSISLIWFRNRITCSSTEQYGFRTNVTTENVIYKLTDIYIPCVPGIWWHSKPRLAKTSHAWDSHSPCHLNIFSQRHENIEKNEVNLHSFFNYAINIILGQLHAPTALVSGKNASNKGLYESGRYGRLCSLFFIGKYFLACVLLPAELLSVLAKSDRVSRYPFRH
jgi:hypothetical protein